MNILKIALLLLATLTFCNLSFGGDLKNIRNQKNFVPAKIALQPLLVGRYGCSDFRKSDNTCNLIYWHTTRNGRPAILTKAWVYESPNAYMELNSAYEIIEDLICSNASDIDVKLSMQPEITHRRLTEKDLSELAQSFKSNLVKDGNTCIAHYKSIEGMISKSYYEDGSRDPEQHPVYTDTHWQTYPTLRLFDKFE